MDYGGDWVTPYPNLDNVKSGFILFFEMMTTEGQVKYMYIVMEERDKKATPFEVLYSDCEYDVITGIQPETNLMELEKEKKK